MQRCGGASPAAPSPSRKPRRRQPRLFIGALPPPRRPAGPRWWQWHVLPRYGSGCFCCWGSQAWVLRGAVPPTRSHHLRTCCRGPAEGNGRSRTLVVAPPQTRAPWRGAPKLRRKKAKRAPAPSHAAVSHPAREEDGRKGRQFPLAGRSAGNPPPSPRSNSGSSVHLRRQASLRAKNGDGSWQLRNTSQTCGRRTYGGCSLMKLKENLRWVHMHRIGLLPSHDPTFSPIVHLKGSCTCSQARIAVMKH